MNTRAWLVALTLASGVVLAEGEASDAAAVPAADTMVAEAAEPVAPPPKPIPAIGSGPNGPFSYAMGFNVGRRVQGDIPGFDPEAFKQGFSEAFAGQPGLLDEAQMAQVVEEFRARMAAEQQAAHDKLAADNQAASDAFLKKNGKRRGVKTTKSGLQYQVLARGKGASPSKSDMVTAHYHGTLLDGSVFDSSRGEEPVQFPLDRVIAGWKEGVQLMNRGAKYKFFVPPALAYGEQGVPEANIGPNQVLVFEIELVDFGPAPQDVPTGE